MNRRQFFLFAATAVSAAAAATKQLQVIAHRGEHLVNPENTMEGIEAAAKLRVDFVELDVRTTADGKFVLMHDATVERMTGVQGKVAEMNWSQLRDLRLKNSASRIPEFSQALEILRSSKVTGLYLDAKQISATAMALLLREHRMEERTVVYGGSGLLRELQQTGCRARVMPEARNIEVLRALLTELHPEVLAFDHRDWNPELIALAKAGGVADLFVDRLGPNDTESAWEDALRMGATGIQTDHPGDLLAWRGKKHEKA